MLKYIISFTTDNYIGSIGYGKSANKEILNYNEIDFNFLNAYKYDEVKKIAILDETRKQEIIKEREEEKRKEQEPTKEEKMDAQILYTALMTDTLLESEEE